VSRQDVKAKNSFAVLYISPICLRAISVIACFTDSALKPLSGLPQCALGLMRDFEYQYYLVLLLIFAKLLACCTTPAG
jgi:hypothetical protein